MIIYLRDKMNYFSNIFIVLTVLCVLIGCEKTMPCRKGSHPLGVLLHQKPYHSKLKGLEKYDYTFYLISSYETINDYQIAFKGSFPVNINFSLNNKIAYQFNPSVFCLNFLIKGKVNTLKGDLLQYHSQDTVISGIWITIDEMLIIRPIEKDKPHSNSYYIMSKVYLSQMPTEIIVMKKMLNQKGSFYQLVIAEIYLSSSNKGNGNEDSNYQDDYLRMGTETLIKSIDGSDAVGMENGKKYSAVLPIGSSIYYFAFDKVNNIICLNEMEKDNKCIFT